MSKSLTFNAPPGWEVPEGFIPTKEWRPDPSWPAAPAGWSWWSDPGIAAPWAASAQASPHRRPSRTVLGGAIGIAASAMLPWVSVFGISVHQSGSGVVVLLAVGGLLAWLARRSEATGATRASMVALWVLAVFDSLLIAGLLDAVSSDRSALVSISIGFYVCLAGLVASIVGTVMLQVSRRRSRRAPDVIDLSAT